MAKLKCWKKHNDRIYFKNKGKKNAEAIHIVQGQVFHIHGIKNARADFIGEGKDKMLKFMKSHDKC